MPIDSNDLDKNMISSNSNNKISDNQLISSNVSSVSAPIIKKIENNHFNNMHGHTHSHKYKSSREKAHHDHHKMHEKEINNIKLIAWMVLMGDG
jgi:hypothetical protein